MCKNLELKLFYSMWKLKSFKLLTLLIACDQIKLKITNYIAFGQVKRNYSIARACDHLKLKMTCFVTCM